MTETAFPKFLNLPAELQIQIWRMAVRPPPSKEYGGVHQLSHFFHQTKKRYYWDESKPEPDDDDKKEEIRIQLHKLAVTDKLASGRVEDEGTRVPEELERTPKDPAGSSDHNSLELNPSKVEDFSSYRWDMGLWNACKKSREMMEEELKRRRIRKREEEKFGLKPFTEHPLSALVEKDGEKLLLRADSNRDLFIYDHKAFPPRANMQMAIKVLPFPFSMSTPPNFDDGIFSHIALEYDSSWMPDDDLPDFWELEYEDTPRGALARLLNYRTELDWDDAPGPPFIWLIDRNIQPERDLGNDFEFYDSDGKRYHGASINSRRLQDWHDKDRSVFHFLDLLDTCAMSVLEFDPYPEEEWSDREPISLDIDEFIGVLRCE